MYHEEDGRELDNIERVEVQKILGVNLVEISQISLGHIMKPLKEGMVGPLEDSAAMRHCD